MPDIQVNLPETSYTIRIVPGLLSQIGSELREISRARRAVVVTDPNVAALHLPAVRQSLLDGGFDPLIAIIPAGEQNKLLQSLLPVFDSILAGKIERSTPLLALGGGIVGDMAGFVAATILRGIPLVQVPTTLLAMVDSSVGGKTGVNHAAGKNLIGAFYQPVRVLADPKVLTTLPRAELVGGLAECIKHDVIRDAVGFHALENHLESILSLDLPTLTDLIAHNVRIKATVVQADPFEHGERAHLNFGHTFAHAIEKASNHAYSHGQAVALGMVAAAGLAGDLGMLDESSVARIVRLIASAGLPTGQTNLDPEQIVAAMAFDKKVISSKVQFILPDRIGHVVIRDDVSTAQALKATRRITTEIQ